MKTGILLLARTGSTRLPGKVLKNICGKPILEHILWRLGHIAPCDECVVATTTNTNDDVIVDLCEKLGVQSFRGSEDNVLDRCIGAAEAFKLDVVIRIGADSPFIDWEIVNDMLSVFLAEEDKGNSLDYLSNSLERSFPLGLDADVMRTTTLLKIAAATKIMSAEQRTLNEINVLPYLHQNLNLFKYIAYKKDFDYSDLRWTLDTAEDFDLATRVYEALYKKTPNFLMRDILALIAQQPELATINKHVVPRSGYWTATEKGKLSQRLAKS